MTTDEAAASPKGAAVPGDAGGKTRSAAGTVLMALAAGQFLMILDSSVMNVSIATVAEDVGTTVAGIQTAITLYTLVMASLVIVGGKLGTIIGRKRAFAIGLVIYASGSLTTALSPTLPWLLFGWSFLEGVGAALILPAIVALVAGNFPAPARPKAYGLIAAAAAIAVAVGPLIGGLATTYASWRWVFAGEVVVAALILLFARRIQDAPPARRPHLDLIGAVLSAAGLAMIVLGVLKTSEWGWVEAKTDDSPALFGLSMSLWLIMGGIMVIWAFFRWQARLQEKGKEPLIDPALLEVRQLRAGLVSFFSQYFLQAGVFFLVPLFLSIVLGMSAIDTGLRLVPLSLTLLLAAVGVPKLRPNANPRRVVRIGLLCFLVGLLLLLGGLDLDADASVVAIPMLLIGFGIGAMASQLGAVTVSAVPDDKSPDVGGLQNTVTNLGISLSTALVGSILIAVLTSAFIANIENNPNVPDSVKQQASVELVGGIPFMSDADLEEAMKEAGQSEEVTQAALEANAEGRIAGLHTAFAVLAILACLAIVAAQRLPTKPVGGGAPKGVTAAGEAG
jgi:EmrB/QacA subfamily drug resistance transporter